MQLAEFYRLLAQETTARELRGTRDNPLVVGADDPVHPKAELPSRLFRQPVRIEHIRFECYVDLSDCIFRQSLRIEHCTFEHGLRLADTTVRGRLSLKECTFKAPQRRWLDFSRLRVGGLLHMSGVTAHACLNMKNLHTGDSVWFERLHAKSMLRSDEDVQCAKTVWKEATEKARCKYLMGKAVYVAGSDIGKNCFFTGDGEREVSIDGEVDLRATIAGDVEFSIARITHTGSVAVQMQAAQLGGSVLFANVTVAGKVNMRLTKVEAKIEFYSASICAGEGGESSQSAAQKGNRTNLAELDLGGAKVGGFVALRDGTRIDGEVSMFGATYASALVVTRDFNERRFDSPISETDRPLTVTGRMDLRYLKVHGPVLFHYTRLNGPIELEQADVDGHIDFAGGVLGTDTGVNTVPALNLRMAKIHGRLWLMQQVIFGTLDAEDAQIEGEANFSGCRVHGDLLLRSTKVLGRIFADEKGSGDKPDQREANDTAVEVPYPQVTGRVDLRHARLAQVRIRFKKVAQNGTGENEGRAVRAAEDTPTSEPRFIPDTIQLEHATIEELEIAGPLPKPDPKGRKDERFTVHNLTFRELRLDDLDTAHLPESRRSGRGLSPRDYGRVCIWVVLIALFVGMLLQRRADVAWWAAGIALGSYIVFSWVHWRRAKRAAAKERYPLLDFLEHGTQFSRAFYIVVERWKRGQGDDELADEVFLSRRRRELADAPRHGATRGGRASTDNTPRERWYQRRVSYYWRWALDFCMGYGVRVERLVHLYVLFWLLNWAVFLNPASVERPLDFEVQPVLHRADEEGRGAAPEPVPVLPQWAGRALAHTSFAEQWLLAWRTAQDAAARQAQANVDAQPKPKPDEAKGWAQGPDDPNPWPGDGGRPGPGEWSQQQAFFMAMRLQVPLLEMMVEQHWKPADREIEAPWPLQNWFGVEHVWLRYDSFAAVMRTANLILVPLLIAGLTGFLKRRD